MKWKGVAFGLYKIKLGKIKLVFKYITQKFVIVLSSYPYIYIYMRISLCKYWKNKYGWSIQIKILDSTKISEYLSFLN